MRIRITLENSVNKNIVLPVHYNYLLQSFIYSNIDEKLASFLHDKGFIYEKRSFKMFVFSRISSNQFRLTENKGYLYLGSNIYFYLSSPLDQFISQFAEHLFKKHTFNLGENSLVLRDIFVLPEPEFKENAKIKMLSPVTVYSTFYKEEKRKTYYYSPFEKEFALLLKENLVKKYISFYKHPINFDFEIKPCSVNKNLEKIIFYKGTVIKGWLGNYSLKSTPEIIKFSYHTGLGAKNSQGFGMFEICS